MKKWLLILFIILNMGAQTQVRFSTVPFTATADYVPATISFKWGSETAGTEVQFAIYDASKVLVVNSTSSRETRPAANTEDSASFTNCTALTPGGKYYVGAVQDGYVGLISHSSGETYIKAGSLDSPPATLEDATWSGANPFYFAVKNAVGQTLLSYGVFADGTSVTYGPSTIGYENSGYTCATL